MHTLLAMWLVVPPLCYSDAPQPPPVTMKDKLVYEWAQREAHTDRPTIGEVDAAYGHLLDVLVPWVHSMDFCDGSPFRKQTGR
jgi:hypothetical protein